MLKEKAEMLKKREKEKCEREMHMSAALAAFQLFSISAFSFSLLNPAVEFTTKVTKRTKRNGKRNAHERGDCRISAFQLFSFCHALR
jgi:hypothetical protein